MLAMIIVDAAGVRPVADAVDIAKSVAAGRFFWLDIFDPDATADVAHLAQDPRVGPQLIVHRIWSPPFGGGTHNCLPLTDRNLLIVLDEAVLDNMEDGFKPIWVFDNQVKSNPISIATFPLPNDRDYVAVGGHFGPHNIHENRPGSFQSSRLIFATYQNAGVGIYDITDPFRPVEVGACVPPLRRNSSIRAQTGQSCSTPPPFSSTRTDSATAPIGAVPASTRQEASSRHRARAARSYARLSPDRSFRSRGRGERSVALRTRHKKGIPARS